MVLLTDKRFQIIHLGNPYDFVVKDHQTNRTYGTLQGDDKSLMELLNKLSDENEQLKKALRELLEEYGNSYYIDLFDKLFNLEYREWYNPTAPNNEPYVDWEKIAKEKELEE